MAGTHHKNQLLNHLVEGMGVGVMRGEALPFTFEINFCPSIVTMITNTYT